MSMDLTYTHIFPPEVIQAEQQRISAALARNDEPNLDPLTLIRLAISILGWRLRNVLKESNLPCRVAPWSMTPSGSVKVTVKVATEADLNLIQSRLLTQPPHHWTPS